MSSFSDICLYTIFSDDVLLMIGKLVLAGFLGALIGLERDIHGRSAGLRTHLLVAMGATLFMLISQEVSGADPSRIAAQIVSGIGFLGAGAIMKEGITVRGLTTASCLWVVAAVGMAVGVDQVGLAMAATFIALFSLSMLNNFDKFFKRESYRVLTVAIPHDEDSRVILDAINDKHITVLFVDYDHDSDTGICTLRITLRLLHKGITDEVFSSIFNNIHECGIPVSRVTWRHGKMS